MNEKSCNNTAKRLALALLVSLLTWLQCGYESTAAAEGATATDCEVCVGFDNGAVTVRGRVVRRGAGGRDGSAPTQRDAGAGAPAGWSAGCFSDRVPS